MTKFTDGNWYVKEKSGFDYGSTEYRIESDKQSFDSLGTHISRKDDAQLISASKELYLACKEALEQIEQLVGDKVIMPNTVAENRLREALRKVGGNDT